ncbi:MAG: FliA/WhiG family RNA polymerase sigma factor [Ignavibacteriales bacterium]|nr:FliA/WhiG family RNA polymerase sigma factor [Ignavibacteriales bacterium]
MTDVRQQHHRSINGDPKRELFFTHLGLVGYVVNKLGVPMNRSSAALEKQDLVQFGVMGLLDAVERFDPGRGVQFQTYAMSRIRGTIQDELRKLDWVPRSVRKKIRDAEAMTNMMDQKLSAGYSVQQIAEKLSITMEEYLEALEEVQQMSVGSMVSLHETADAIIGDNVVSSDDPFETTSQEELKGIVVRAIESLPEKERLVIVLYYYEEITFKEIGKVLNLSESRAFQIHTAVLQALRRKLGKLL